jgi:hypothetical protein
MMISQQDVFDVPAAQATILTVREVSSYQRTFAFRNLTTASTLSIIIEYSDDGGASWDTAVLTFTVTPGSTVVKNVASTITGILRVRASGGGEDRDVLVGYSRVYETSALWTDPTL